LAVERGATRRHRRPGAAESSCVRPQTKGAGQLPCLPACRDRRCCCFRPTGAGLDTLAEHSSILGGPSGQLYSAAQVANLLTATPPLALVRRDLLRRLLGGDEGACTTTGRAGRRRSPPATVAPGFGRRLGPLGSRPGRSQPDADIYMQTAAARRAIGFSEWLPRPMRHTTSASRAARSAAPRRDDRGRRVTWSPCPREDSRGVCPAARQGASSHS
jgi:hypothetical protein